MTTFEKGVFGKPFFSIEEKSPLWQCIKDNQEAQKQITQLLKDYKTAVRLEKTEKLVIALENYSKILRIANDTKRKSLKLQEQYAELQEKIFENQNKIIDLLQSNLLKEE